jgi:hypothetical protein
MPASLTAAELATGWPKEGGVYYRLWPVVVHATGLETHLDWMPAH